MDGAPSSRELRFSIIAFLLCLSLSALDQNIVSTALPRIASELGGFQKMSLVMTAYMATSALSIALSGFASDLLGRKRMLLSSIGLFLLGSILCGIASSMSWLVAFRCLQGFGAGGITVLCQASLADLLPARERGRYQGMFALTFALSSILAPLLGGVMTQILSWRTIFDINIPVGAVAILLIGRFLPTIRHQPENHAGRKARPGLSFLKNPLFLASSAVNTIVLTSILGSVTFLPLLFQVVRQASPTASGLMVSPMMIGLVVSSTYSGKHFRKTGHYLSLPFCGLFLGSLSYLLLALTIHFSLGLALCELSVFGIGISCGAIMPNMSSAIQVACKRHEIGGATSCAYLVRTLGGVIGVSFAGHMLASAVAPMHVSQAALKGLEDSTLHVTQAAASLRAVVGTAYEHAITLTTLGAVGLNLAGILILALARNESKGIQSS